MSGRMAGMLRMAVDPDQIGGRHAHGYDEMVCYSASVAIRRQFAGCLCSQLFPRRQEYDSDIAKLIAIFCLLHYVECVAVS